MDKLTPLAPNRELDAGKSTVRGTTNYAEGKGKSVITDADTMIEISGILENNQRGDIKVEKLADELTGRGYELELTEVDGKKAIRFRNGDLFVDSSGDGQLGVQDLNFQSALGAIEQKFGLNLGNLKYSLETLEIQGKLRRQARKMAEAGMLSGGFELVEGRDLEELLGELDAQLARAGYRGPESAYELWRSDRLQQVLEQLGLSLPVPRRQDVAFDLGMTRSLGLFGLALELAGRLGR